MEGFKQPAQECPHTRTGGELDSLEDDGLSADREALGAGAGNAPLAFAGFALNTAEANEIARSARTRLVVVAGMAECGKSALVACPFHELLNGSFGGYEFAGSQTLLAFEERGYRSRVSSGRIAPTMKRTDHVDDPKFLHLCLARSGTNVSSAFGRDLLVTDLSGETFRRIRDNVEEAKRLTICDRADRIAVLFDGARLADVNRRQGAAREVFSLLRSLSAAGYLGPTRALDLVITKWDLIEASAKDEILPFIDELESRAQELDLRVSETRWHRTAALPVRIDTPMGFGVSELLECWMERSQLLRASLSGRKPASLPITREYVRYADRFGYDAR